MLLLLLLGFLYINIYGGLATVRRGSFMHFYKSVGPSFPSLLALFLNFPKAKKPALCFTDDGGGGD